MADDEETLLLILGSLSAGWAMGFSVPADSIEACLNGGSCCLREVPPFLLELRSPLLSASLVAGLTDDGVPVDGRLSLFGLADGADLSPGFVGD